MNIRHNNRTREEVENGSFNNPLGHVKADKVDENVHILTQTEDEAYEELFGEAVKKYDEKQGSKHKDRQYGSAKAYKTSMKHKKNGQKAAYELVFTFGNKEDWDKTGPYSQETSNEIFKEVFDRMDEKFPNFKFFNVAIHNDESGAPHMHADFIPYTTGNKRGLETQVNMTGAMKSVEGLTKFEQTHSKATVTNTMKEIMTDVLKEKTGIKRRVVGDNRSSKERQDSIQYVKTMRNATAKADKVVEDANKEATGIKEKATVSANAAKMVLQGQIDDLKAERDNLVEENKTRVEDAKQLKLGLKKAKETRFSMWGDYKSEMADLYDNLKTTNQETKDEWAEATDEYNSALRMKNTARKMMSQGGWLGGLLGAGVMFLQQRKELEAKEQIDAINAQKQAILDQIKETRDNHFKELSNVNEQVNNAQSALNSVWSDVREANTKLSNTRNAIKEFSEKYSKLPDLAMKADEAKTTEASARAYWDMAFNATTPEEKAEVREELEQMGRPEVSEQFTAMAKADANRIAQNFDTEEVPEQTEESLAEEFNINLNGIELPDEPEQTEETGFDLSNGLDDLNKNQNGMQR